MDSVQIRPDPDPVLTGSATPLDCQQSNNNYNFWKIILLTITKHTDKEGSLAKPKQFIERDEMCIFSTA